jgi:hypothetical protein
MVEGKSETGEIYLGYFTFKIGQNLPKELWIRDSSTLKDYLHHGGFYVNPKVVKSGGLS